MILKADQENKKRISQLHKHKHKHKHKPREDDKNHRHIKYKLDVRKL